jgi:hypothetical protein
MIITVVLDMKSSYTYGAGSQAAGINREDFRSAMKILTDNDIHYVYCLDAMLQWNIIFASRETIIARWRKTDDRVPRYIIEVDQALAKGYPVAIVYKKRPSPTDPPHINVVLNPDRDLITKNFVLTTN